MNQVQLNSEGSENNEDPKQIFENKNEKTSKKGTKTINKQNPDDLVFHR